jgi:hypothetical protein
VETYTGTDTDDKVYTLKITDKTSYELLIDGVSISTGTAVKSGDDWVLSPSSPGDSFTVIVDKKNITEIEGIITADNGDLITPGSFVEPEPEKESWNWYTIDDSTPNPHMNPQTIFTPGGASRITNAAVDAQSGETNKPYIYPPGEAKDNDGNPIDAAVYNFTGVTKVSSANRLSNQGAQFPMVGWEAVPDEEMLALLKTAYSYSFYVRLNSGTGDQWAFLTAVETDFAPDKGYEYKHWYGNDTGDSGGSSTNNLTDGLEVGTWYKIIVVMDTKSANFNMEQDAWMHNYGQPFLGDFNQAEAKKIQWQIPLQHQKGETGVEERGGDPYDITNGEYEFSLDLYGLELNQ